MIRRPLLGVLVALALLLPLPTDANPYTTRTNCSGTIATGGVAQELLRPDGGRHGFQIQNLSTDPLAWSDVTTSPATFTAGSYTLDAATASTADGAYSTPATYSPTGAIYIIGATNGDAFTCSAW